MSQARTPLIALLAALCLPGLSPALRAAELEAEPSAVRYLPLDDETSELASQLQALAAQEEWRELIELCQKTLTEPGSGVVELRTGVYGGAAVLCRARLAELPEAARQLYRTLHDPQAQSLYEQALAERDVAAARRLVSEFPIATRSRDGLGLLGELLVERGEVHGAARCWSRWAAIAKDEPPPEAERRRLAAKLAVAAAMTGDRAALDEALDLFGPKGSVVTAGEARLVRREDLEAYARGLWRGAAAGRAAVPPDLSFERWRLRADAPSGEDRGHPEAVLFGGGPLGRRDAATPRRHGVLADGVLYLNTQAGPVALDALTGRVVWRRPAANTESHHLALHPFNLYARVHPSLDPRKGDVLFVSGGAQLAAYDATTGTLLWRRHRGSFAKVEGFGPDPELRVAFSSPVVVRGRLAYVIVETSRGEVYLLALTREAGKLAWARPIGGDMPRPHYGISIPSALTLAGSDVLFCNGHGLIGACDAETGRVRWLVAYRRQTQIAENEYYDRSGALHFSPLALAGDAVICLPADGGEMISVRRTDGTVRWRKELPGRSHLLGAAGPTAAGDAGRVFLVGTTVRCLSADAGSVLWTWPLPEEDPAGMGVLTQKEILVATRGAVYRLDGASGELVGLRPLRLSTEEPVHACADAGGVAVLAEMELRVFGDPMRTRELLDQAAAEGAGFPQARLVRARLLWAEGDREGAARHLTEAAENATPTAEGAAAAPDLKAEAVKLHHQLFASAWKHGSRFEAFRWLRRALFAEEDSPYLCRLGYPADESRDASSPHRLVTVSGDVLYGRLTGAEWGLVRFVVRGEPWTVAASGIRYILLEPGTGGVGGPVTGTGFIALKNGDRITAQIESVRDGRARLRAEFSTFELRLKDVKALGFGGTPEPQAEGRVVYVRMADGSRVGGRMSALDEAGLVLDMPSCGVRRLLWEDVRTISNRAQGPSSRGESPGARAWQFSLEDRPFVDGEHEVFLRKEEHP